MVYQYDRFFGYGYWMTSIPTTTHILIFCCILLGYCNIWIGCHGNQLGNSEYPKNIKVWVMVRILVIHQPYPKSLSYWYTITSTLWMESAWEFMSENAIQQALMYLAMVTAKIAITINDSKPIDMLLDSRSKLNIITQELQEGLGLPMYPSGANWTLHGVSGHPVHSVGVCQNIPINIGGMGFNHHFFITQDKIGEKGMIGGEPWLFNHTVCIDYIVGRGLQLQVWKDGNWENPSIWVSIPIIQSQQNVYKVTVQHPHEVSAAAISLESNELDINQFALQSYESWEATWEPVKPSLIASQGHAPQIPRLGNSLIEAFNTTESNIDKFGPLPLNIDYINKYMWHWTSQFSKHYDKRGLWWMYHNLENLYSSKLKVLVKPKDTKIMKQDYLRSHSHQGCPWVCLQITRTQTCITCFFTDHPSQVLIFCG